MKNINDVRFDSLQALRTLAFLGVFLCHAGSTVHWSGFGVSIFFVMSGFLLYYLYEERVMNISFWNNLKFSFSKIKKLYPLHIITTCGFILLALLSIYRAGITLKSIIDLLVKIVLNITLLQTWIPNSRINTCLNGVTWYLSVAMFLYFVFPWICKLIKKINKYMLLIIPAMILVAQVFGCVLVINKFGIDSLVYKWFMYSFPIFRLGDFVIGCCLGKIYKKLQKIDINCIIGTIIEIVVILITALVFIWRESGQSTVFMKALFNWTTVYIVLACLWIYMFAQRKGVITKLLSNKVMIYIGNISSYAFLIHYVITQYAITAIRYLNIQLSNPMKWGVIIFELLLSIGLSILYKKVEEKIKICKST